MLTFAVKKKRTPSIAPKHHAPTVSPMYHSLHLQQAKVRHILRSLTFQPKLTIGQPNDKYEQEADRVADEVMRMPEPQVQRQVEPEEEEEETLQTKPLASQITPLVQVQRQEEPEEEEEEEAIQTKLADGMQVQRQVEPEEEEEEETLQPKPLVSQITPLVQVQRQEEPEEEEEELQAKPLSEQITPLVQRQVEPEEEEEEEEEAIQTKLADGMQVQRQEEPEEEEEEEAIQTKQVSTRAPAVSPNLASRIQSLKGGGQPLPESERAFFERCFGGYDFSRVRVHTDAKAAATARALNARAYTFGRDVVFGAGQYAPGIEVGQRLLAHELTHVMQQVPGITRHPVPAPPLQTRGPLWHKAMSYQPPLKPHTAKAPVSKKIVLKELTDCLTKKKIARLFHLLRTHHSWLRGFSNAGSVLGRHLKHDARWYGLALLYYGPEQNWPFPARFRPPNPVPNTTEKYYEMLRTLKTEERKLELKTFFTKVFPYGSQAYYHSKYLFFLGPTGHKEWILSLFQLYALSSKIHKGKIFHALRAYQGTFTKNKKSFEPLLKEKLRGNDLWYGLGLFYYGPEKMWPLPAKYKSPKAPNTKGKFFQMLRNIYKDEGEPKFPKKPKPKPNLETFINRVFQYGDKTYALNLCMYGIEPNWDPDVVKKLSGEQKVQPEITEKATGYKAFKGKEFIKGITYDDIKQGFIGDCYLMAALAAIAKLKPTLLDKMIEINANGTYTVYFYNTEKGNVIHKEYLLPGFPVRSGQIIYAKSKQRAELWVSILEKAFAAWHGRGGGYKKIDFGGVSDFFEKLTGKQDYEAISKVKYFKEIKVKGERYYLANPIKPIKKPVMSEGKVKSKIKGALKNMQPIVAGTYSPPWNLEEWKKVKDRKEKKEIIRQWKKELGQIFKTYNKTKCIPHHSYAVLGITDSKIQLYNPHGKELELEVKTFTEIFQDLWIGAKLNFPQK